MRLVCPNCTAPFFAADDAAPPRCPNCDRRFPPTGPADAIPVARAAGPPPSPPVRSRAATVLALANGAVGVSTAVYTFLLAAIDTRNELSALVFILGGLSVLLLVSAVGLFGRWRAGRVLGLLVAGYSVLVVVASVAACNPCVFVGYGIYAAFAFRVLLGPEAGEEFGR